MRDEKNWELVFIGLAAAQTTSKRCEKCVSQHRLSERKFLIFVLWMKDKNYCIHSILTTFFQNVWNLWFTSSHFEGPGVRLFGGDRMGCACGEFYSPFHPHLSSHSHRTHNYPTAYCWESMKMRLLRCVINHTMNRTISMYTYAHEKYVILFRISCCLFVRYCSLLNIVRMLLPFIEYIDWNIATLIVIV